MIVSDDVMSSSSSPSWQQTILDLSLVGGQIVGSGQYNTPGVYHQLSSGFKLKHDRLMEMTMAKLNLWK
jgi:hypothetical protein